MAGINLRVKYMSWSGTEASKSMLLVSLNIVGACLDASWIDNGSLERQAKTIFCQGRGQRRDNFMKAYKLRGKGTWSAQGRGGLL